MHFVSLLLNEDQGSAQDALYEILESQVALVPSHWPNEIANALRRAVRRKRIAAAEITSVVAQLDAFNIRLAAPPDVTHITSLVKHSLASDLSVYDLQYVRLAKSHDLPLATLDEAMRRAARSVNVAVLPEDR